MNSLDEAWEATVSNFARYDYLGASFNVWLLQELRPRWGDKVRPASSMTRLLFMAPDDRPFRWTEHVYVEYQSAERVEMALRRDVPRRSLTAPGGAGVVTGDFTRPENAVPAVEALLHQLDLDREDG